MDITRSSGILLAVTSLPGPHGSGDLGAEAYALVDQLVRAGQGIWQVLPLGPTGYGNSPYQCFSAFAGNPLLVDLRELSRQGWLAEEDLAHPPAAGDGSLDYERVIGWRMARLRRAFERFESLTRDQAELRSDLARFAEENRHWLDDFALFMAIKGRHGEVAWTNWPMELVMREPAAIAAWKERLAGEIRLHQFIQWRFFRQWQALKRYANKRGVRIVGDVPIFVAHDSADVWANQADFRLDERGVPLVVAGVPPDYFSATGQLWGNPLYRWDRMAAGGYAWWQRRLSQAMALYDWVRLDHFRGFEAYWEVPGDAPTAVSGRWVAGPGAAFFAEMTARLGPLPLVAEDLGVITPAVEALRDQFGYPGMRVLQFAFGDDPKAADYRPHRYISRCVVYTGTHDNDTTAGWFHSQPGRGSTRAAEQIARERQLVLRYLGTDGREVHWDFIRLAMASVARWAIFPMQDVLGLGSQARMNLPGTLAGNWRWRLRPGQFDAEHERRLRELAEIFERKLFPA
jgi:4-alpha-glucanotransferase